MKQVEYGEEDWKRDNAELDRFYRMRDLEEKEDGLELPIESWVKPEGEDKKFVKVRFLGEYDLIEGERKRVGDVVEVVDWLAKIWVGKGYVKMVND